MSWVISDVIMEKALKYDQGISNPIKIKESVKCIYYGVILVLAVKERIIKLSDEAKPLHY